MTTTIKYFKYDHLPPKLQEVSKPIGDLAMELEQSIPDGPEKSAGMRKLLEAKDCFVRASLEPTKYGCYCERDPGESPDGCLIDEGRPYDCVHASRVASKEQCEYWRPLLAEEHDAPGDDNNQNLIKTIANTISKIGLNNKKLSIKQLRYIKDCILQGKTVTLADVMSV